MTFYQFVPIPTCYKARVNGDDKILGGLFEILTIS